MVKIAIIAEGRMNETSNISAKSRVLIVKLVAVALYHRDGGKLKGRKPEGVTPTGIPVFYLSSFLNPLHITQV